ncbi:hypothetical protein WDW37_00330 [Bdellovibrionota bacterium FG-1]
MLFYQARPPIDLKYVNCSETDEACDQLKHKLTVTFDLLYKPEGVDPTFYGAFEAPPSVCQDMKESAPLQTAHWSCVFFGIREAMKYELRNLLLAACTDGMKAEQIAELWKKSATSCDPKKPGEFFACLSKQTGLSLVHPVQRSFEELGRLAQEMRLLHQSCEQSILKPDHCRRDELLKWNSVITDLDWLQNNVDRVLTLQPGFEPIRVPDYFFVVNSCGKKQERHKKYVQPPQPSACSKPPMSPMSQPGQEGMMSAFQVAALSEETEDRDEKSSGIRKAMDQAFKKLLAGASRGGAKLSARQRHWLEQRRHDEKFLAKNEQVLSKQAEQKAADKNGILETIEKDWTQALREALKKVDLTDGKAIALGEKAEAPKPLPGEEIPSGESGDVVEVQRIIDPQATADRKAEEEWQKKEKEKLLAQAQAVLADPADPLHKKHRTPSLHAHPSALLRTPITGPQLRFATWVFEDHFEKLTETLQKTKEGVTLESDLARLELVQKLTRLERDLSRADAVSARELEYFLRNELATVLKQYQVTPSESLQKLLTYGFPKPSQFHGDEIRWPDGVTVMPKKKPKAVVQRQPKLSLAHQAASSAIPESKELANVLADAEKNLKPDQVKEFLKDKEQVEKRYQELVEQRKGKGKSVGISDLFKLLNTDLVGLLKKYDVSPFQAISLAIKYGIPSLPSADELAAASGETSLTSGLKPGPIASGIPGTAQANGLPDADKDGGDKTTIYRGRVGSVAIAPKMNFAIMTDPFFRWSSKKTHSWQSDIRGNFPVILGLDPESLVAFEKASEKGQVALDSVMKQIIIDGYRNHPLEHNRIESDRALEALRDPSRIGSGAADTVRNLENAREAVFIDCKNYCSRFPASQLLCCQDLKDKPNRSGSPADLKLRDFPDLEARWDQMMVAISQFKQKVHTHPEAFVQALGGVSVGEMKDLDDLADEMRNSNLAPEVGPDLSIDQDWKAVLSLFSDPKQVGMNSPPSGVLPRKGGVFLAQQKPRALGDDVDSREAQKLQVPRKEVNEVEQISHTTDEVFGEPVAREQSRQSLVKGRSELVPHQKGGVPRAAEFGQNEPTQNPNPGRPGKKQAPQESAPVEAKIQMAPANFVMGLILGAKKGVLVEKNWSVGLVQKLAGDPTPDLEAMDQALFSNLTHLGAGGSLPFRDVSLPPGKGFCFSTGLEPSRHSWGCFRQFGIALSILYALQRYLGSDLSAGNYTAAVVQNRLEWHVSPLGGTLSITSAVITQLYNNLYDELVKQGVQPSGNKVVIK